MESLENENPTIQALGRVRFTVSFKKMNDYRYWLTLTLTTTLTEP